MPKGVVHSPLSISEGIWSHDPRRHLVRGALWVDRDVVFADLFWKFDSEITDEKAEVATSIESRR